MGEPRWLDEREARVWQAYLAVNRELHSAVERQLVRDSGLSNADYAVLVPLSEAPDGVVRSRELGALVGWERFRAAQFGIAHHCTIALNPKEANDPRCAEVLDVLLEYPIASESAEFAIRPGFERLGVEVRLATDDGSACLLVTRRARGLRTNPGQWALPGGRRSVFPATPRPSVSTAGQALGSLASASGRTRSSTPAMLR